MASLTQFLVDDVSQPQCNGNVAPVESTEGLAALMRSLHEQFSAQLAKHAEQSAAAFERLQNNVYFR